MQLALFGSRAECFVRRRVPQEQRQAGRERHVVEPAWLLVEEHETRRREHAGVGGEHGTREARTEIELALEESEEALHIKVSQRPPIRGLHEAAQESFGVLLRVF